MSDICLSQILHI